MPLWAVAFHAYQRDCRGGNLRVKPGISVGPLVAEDEAQIAAWAEPRCLKLFPREKGWDGHAWSASVTPANVLEQVVLESGYVLASETASRAEYEALQRKYDALRKKRRGRESEDVDGEDE